MDTRPCDNCGKYTVFALCDACKGKEAHREPSPPTPPANVHDRHHGAGPAVAAVRDVGAERQAELRGYDLALAHSLQAADHLLQEVAKQRDISVADVFALIGEGLAENRKRLGIQAGVVSDWNG